MALPTALCWSLIWGLRTFVKFSHGSLVSLRSDAGLYELRYAARQRLTADLFIGALLGPMGLRVFSTCPVVNLAIRKG